MYIPDGFILADRISGSNIACTRYFSQVYRSGVPVPDLLMSWFCTGPVLEPVLYMAKTVYSCGIACNRSGW